MSKHKTEPCSVCARPRAEFPQVFKGEYWCSDDCRKVFVGETVVTHATVHAPDPLVRIHKRGV